MVGGAALETVGTMAGTVGLALTVVSAVGVGGACLVGSGPLARLCGRGVATGLGLTLLGGGIGLVGKALLVVGAALSAGGAGLAIFGLGRQYVIPAIRDRYAARRLGGPVIAKDLGLELGDMGPEPCFQ